MNIKEELFKFERENQYKFNSLYTERRLACKRITGPENKWYDAVVMIENQWIKIEEKYRSEDYNDLLVEIEQDTKTGDPGWIRYSKADYLIYGVKDKFYFVDMPKLKNLVETYGDQFPVIYSDKGWGNTKNIAIPWYVITDNKIGQFLGYVYETGQSGPKSPPWGKF